MTLVLERSVSISQQGPAILLPALQRLDEVSRLEPDWDSYGALPPASKALHVAEAIMRKAVDRLGGAAGERGAPYTVMPIADGGVSLEWHGQVTDLELDIGPDGMLSYLLIEHHEAGRRFKEGTDLPLPAALDLIRRVVGLIPLAVDRASKRAVG